MSDTNNAPESINPRDAAIAEMAKNAHERYMSGTGTEALTELAPGWEDGQAADDGPQDEPYVEAGAEQNEEPAPAEAPEAPAQDAASHDPLLTLIVNGQPMQVPQSKVLEMGQRAMQKDLAADRKLQEAAEILRQAQQHGYADAGPSYQDDQGEAWQSGAAQQGAIPVDVPSIVRSELEAQQALESFKRDFADICADPYLMKMAASMEDERLTLVSQGLIAPEPQAVAFARHGQTLREWISKKAPQTQPAPAVQLSQERLARKDNVVTIPKAASARTPAPQEAKPKTPSEVIADMRKARHQAV